jgi:hypothetical protein
MKPTSRQNLLDVINAERAETTHLRPMTEPELSAAVNAIKRGDHIRAANKFGEALSPEAKELPGPEPITNKLHVLEVRRAMAFREVLQLDQRIEAERTGTRLPWQRPKPPPIRRTRTERPTPSEVKEFVGYVRNYYAPENELWPEDAGPAPTEEEIRYATEVVIWHYDLVDQHHPLGPSRAKSPREYDLSSHCREVVRDIILMRRGYQGRTWPELVAQAAGSTHRLEWGALVTTIHMLDRGF